MPVIKRLSAMEILDSRGRPTVWARCELASGASASASVPSGASTGKAEAHELRDGDKNRYGGLGCRKAIANVHAEIANAVCGKSLAEQAQLDAMLRELDGTADKSRLGANAILAVSIAFARAMAMERHVPLYEHFAAMIGERPGKLPRLTVNLFSGGAHAGGQVPIQDVLIVPTSATTIDDALATVYAVFQAAASITNL
jgi:enolase